MQKLTDLIKAHRKALVALASGVIIQLVSNETVDWSAVILGFLAIVGISNDQDAVDRIYGPR